MTFMFWLLVLAGAVLLWTCLAFVFRPIGRLMDALFRGVKESIGEDVGANDFTETEDDDEW